MPYPRKIKEKAEKPQMPPTAGKTENFFTRNIKLMTFLITVGVFLLVFAPIAVMEASVYWGENADARPDMTTSDLIRLSDQKSVLRVADITKFTCDERDQEGYVLVTVDIAPHYTMMASAEKGTGKVIFCEVLSNKTSEKVDLLTEDVRLFLQTN